MSEFFVLIISTVFVNNFVLVKFLGLCPFMGVSNKTESAIGMSIATTFVLTLASGCSYIIHHWILQPYELEYLRTLSFILIIAFVVQFTELLIQKSSPLLHKVLGLFLPLITTNCAVLGVALLNINQSHTFIESLFYGFGAALGFSLVLVLFSAIREKLEYADAPRAFKGTSLAMITAGIMSLAFMGFAGLVKF
jgi:Na+-translocating ferredoxin:NAD+ oxidoreductase subunit A